MNRLPVLAAMVALAVMLGTLGAARATDYGKHAANPACATMRNDDVDADLSRVPNRDDTRMAAQLAGGDNNTFGNLPVFRRQHIQAFGILKKIDNEGTDGLAALPPSTPGIDEVIDKHVYNLVWARSMLGLFAEQGRLVSPDIPQAAAYYQKAVDTSFTDDRGCVHTSEVAPRVMTKLAGFLLYGEGIDKDRAKARTLLTQLGTSAESALYLLDKNALPETYAAYVQTNLNDLAETVRHPPQTDADIMLAFLGRALLWCAVVVVLFVGAIVLVRRIRRRLGYKDEASLYRTVFFVYDRLHGLIARFGLVAEGLIGCFIGLSILLGGFAFGSGFGGFGGVGSAAFGVPYNLVVIISGLGAFLGGVNKLVEAARVSAAPNSSLVHGAARPAAETEAQAAGRGNAKAPDLHDRTFKE